MRILHINCNYIGTTLHQLMIENLDRLGYENKVFVPTYDKNLAVICPNSNVCVCECFRKWDRLLFDYKQKKIFRSLQANFEVASFDCIHAYTLFTDGNCARKLSQKYRIPYVVAVRNTDVNDFFRLMPHLRGRGVQIMRDASAVFFLSEAYRKQVFDRYIPAEHQREIAQKTHIIPNGIDEFWFANEPAGGKQLGQQIKLIYAGRIDKNKNIPTTQKAMQILRQKGYDVTLTVVGKVADKKEYASVKQDVHTICIPAQPKEKLITLYREHDIFVMPSFTESFGLVYAEAMSQGLPVVYSAGQGFDGQFGEGIVGYHANPRSAEAVANAVQKVSDNYQRLSANALVSASKFKWDEIALKYDRIYQSLGVKRNAESTGKQHF